MGSMPPKAIMDGGDRGEICSVEASRDTFLASHVKLYRPSNDGTSCVGLTFETVFNSAIIKLHTCLEQPSSAQSVKSVEFVRGPPFPPMHTTLNGPFNSMQFT